MSSHFSILNHLQELRRRVVWIIIVLAVIFIALYPFASPIYHFVSLPLLKLLPPGGHIIATSIVSPFMAPLKLVFILSLLLTFPVIIYHLWRFIAAGLYRHEKIIFALTIFFSTLLFYCGIAVTYFILSPMAFRFFIGKAPVGVEIMTDIHHYVNFLLSLSLAVGLVFETPIIILLLVLLKVTTHQQLASKRRYIFVGCFIAAMFIAPPEVLCQTLVALPMYVLFEIGLLLASLVEKRQQVLSDSQED